MATNPGQIFRNACFRRDLCSRLSVSHKTFGVQWESSNQCRVQWEQAIGISVQLGQVVTQQSRRWHSVRRRHVQGGFGVLLFPTHRPSLHKYPDRPTHAHPLHSPAAHTHIHQYNRPKNQLKTCIYHNITLCSASYISWQRHIAHSCCRAPAVQQLIDISCRLGTQQQNCRMLLQRLIDGTDRQTPYRYTDPAAYMYMQAVLITCTRLRSETQTVNRWQGILRHMTEWRSKF